MQRTACCLTKTETTHPPTATKRPPPNADLCSQARLERTPSGSFPWGCPRHLGLRVLNVSSPASAPTLFHSPHSPVLEMAPPVTQWQEAGPWASHRLLPWCPLPPKSSRSLRPRPHASPCLPVFVNGHTQLPQRPFPSPPTSSPSARPGCSSKMYRKTFQFFSISAANAP